MSNMTDIKRLICFTSKFGWVSIKIMCLEKPVYAMIADLMRLEIDPKSHAAWTGGKQAILDKGRVSKFNKKFQNFRSENKK